MTIQTAKDTQNPKRRVVAKKPPTPEWKLIAFEWLPSDKWTIDTVMNNYEVNSKRYCKICDAWVPRSDCVAHVEFHVKEEQKMHDRILAERAEQRRLEKEAERLERGLAAPVVSKFYEAPCRVCNKPIRKTGRRGRPPVIHEDCRKEEV